MRVVFEKPDPGLVELQPVALAIDEALVSLHDALRAAQRQGCDLQFLMDAVDSRRSTLPGGSRSMVRLRAHNVY